MNPTFDYEKKLWKTDMRFVGGADEVGRGAFAGPVVAAAVVFDPLNCVWPEKLVIRDSKQMSARQRELSAAWLKENTYWGVGEVGVNIINKEGIVKAASAAFRKAVSELNYHLPKRLEHLLVDAFYVPYLAGLSRVHQTPIVKGDSESASIAAASIIAKAHRDAIMCELSRRRQYKKYMWGKNAGYGTHEHRSAILSNGATHQHRKKYLIKLFASQDLLNA